MAQKSYSLRSSFLENPSLSGLSFPWRCQFWRINFLVFSKWKIWGKAAKILHSHLIGGALMGLMTMTRKPWKSVFVCVPWGVFISSAIMTSLIAVESGNRVENKKLLRFEEHHNSQLPFTIHKIQPKNPSGNIDWILSPNKVMAQWHAPMWQALGSLVSILDGDFEKSWNNFGILLVRRPPTPSNKCQSMITSSGMP